jgi:hypothetical protein
LRCFVGSETGAPALCRLKNTPNKPLAKGREAC